MITWMNVHLLHYILYYIIPNFYLNIIRINKNLRRDSCKNLNLHSYINHFDYPHFSVSFINNYLYTLFTCLYIYFFVFSPQKFIQILTMEVYRCTWKPMSCSSCYPKGQWTCIWKIVTVLFVSLRSKFIHKQNLRKKHQTNKNNLV